MHGVRVPIAVAAVIVVVAGCARDDQLASPLVSSPITTSSTTSSTTSTVAPVTSAPASSAPASTAPPAVETTAPVTEPAPTSAAPPATPASTSPPVTTIGAACTTLDPMPADAAEASSAAIDVDDDGADDIVRTYSVGASPGAGAWHLRVELVTGQGADLVLPDDPAPTAARVIGSAYIGSNVDPGPEGHRPAIFVVTGAGAATTIVSLFRLDGCTLAAMGGGPPFPVGATTTHAESLRCEGVSGHSLLDFRQVQLAGDGVSFEVIDTGYTRDGNDLAIYGAGPITTIEPTMPVARALIDCPGVVNP